MEDLFIAAATHLRNCLPAPIFGLNQVGIGYAPGWVAVSGLDQDQIEFLLRSPEIVDAAISLGLAGVELIAADGRDYRVPALKTHLSYPPRNWPFG